jgi:hypothetical protein
VNRAQLAYDSGGIKALKPKPNGGRKHENMTLSEEKVLQARFAKVAGAGQMLNIHDLKAAYEKAAGNPNQRIPAIQEITAITCSALTHSCIAGVPLSKRCGR